MIEERDKRSQEVGAAVERKRKGDEGRKSERAKRIYLDESENIV